MDKGKRQAEVDDLVAEFTGKLLSVARKEGIEFDYAGHGLSKTDEVVKVMQINLDTVKGLMKE